MVDLILLEYFGGIFYVALQKIYLGGIVCLEKQKKQQRNQNVVALVVAEMQNVAVDKYYVSNKITFDNE